MTVNPEIKTSKPVVKRMTKQRRIIKEILCSTTSHPTAEAIYEEARKVLPDIGLGTVYRNLQVLVEEGSAIELTGDKRFSHYDGNVAPHAHLYCEKCNRVFDIDMEISNDIANRAIEKTGAVINNYRLDFYGCCEECRKKEMN